MRVVRRYRDTTLILETEFETQDGAITLVDFMPLRGRSVSPHPVGARETRQSPGEDGTHDTVRLRSIGALGHPSGRRDHARHCRTRHDRASHAGAAARRKSLRPSANSPWAKGKRSLSFCLTALLTARFRRQSTPNGRSNKPKSTGASGPDRCNYRGPWDEAVCRSSHHAESAHLSAQRAESLPLPPPRCRNARGARNWDYRFCWLRDATFTLLALMNAGYYDEAKAWRRLATAGRRPAAPAQLQIMYGVAGERRLTEWEVPWLPGYPGRAPVRVGNAAVGQLQLDVLRRTC